MSDTINFYFRGRGGCFIVSLQEIVLLDQEAMVIVLLDWEVVRVVEFLKGS